MSRRSSRNIKKSLKAEEAAPSRGEVRANLCNFLLSPGDDDDDLPQMHSVVALGWLPHYSRLKRDLKKKKPEDLTERECEILEIMTDMEADVRISTKWINHNLHSFAEDCIYCSYERGTADGETPEEREIDMRMVDSSLERVRVVYGTKSNDDITMAIFEKDRRSEVAALTKAHDDFLGRIKVREGINDGTIRNMGDIDKLGLQGPFNDYHTRLLIVEETKIMRFRQKAMLFWREAAEESDDDTGTALLTSEEAILVLSKDATRLLDDDDLDEALENFGDLSMADVPVVASSNTAGLPPRKKSFVDFLNNEATKVFTDDDDMRFLNKVRHIRRAFLLDPGWAKHNLPNIKRLVVNDGRASKAELYRNPAPTLVYNNILGEVNTHKVAEFEEQAEEAPQA